MWGGRISFLGMLALNEKLFDGLTMPGDLSKDVFLKRLAADAAELEICYTDPQILEQLISAWSYSMQYEWGKLYALTQLEYNPIHNYDRTEHEEINDIGHSEGKSDGKSEDFVTGYNQDSYSPKDKSEGNSSAESDSTLNRIRDYKNYGNIGVTTTQQMMMQEKDVVAKLNIYDIMAKDFINKFCIQLY